MSDDPSESAGSDAGADRPRNPAAEDPADAQAAADAADGDGVRADDPGDGEDLEALRERVEQEYDFEEFGPADMAEMSGREWEAVFEDDAWVTGERLLDRVEADLRSRVADREVFAVVERTAGDRPRVVAYSDEGYAVVDADGTVEGRGTVLRDVKPSVALASMPEYEVPDPPEDAGLPAPDEVPGAGGGLGNLVMLFLAGLMLLSGVVLLGATLLVDVGGAALITAVVGVGFLLTGLFLGVVVANARLSARFRAEEYRDRLRAAGVDEGERPDFLPVDDREFED